jgi:molybdopterin adenylyltransferase
MSETAHDPIKIGLVTVSDRASKGIYQDEGIPALRAWLTQVLFNPMTLVERIIPDERHQIEATLKQLADDEVGTGPAPRDVTPDATLAVADRVMDGFGEAMRAVSLKYVPTAILSRQVAVLRKQSLIINLPGQPKSIKETLDGIFAAVPYCVDLIGGPYVETREQFIKTFRPKSAIRPARG